MKVIIEKDYQAISKVAGKIVVDAVKENPNLVLGLATGSTPIGLYKEMIRAHKEEGLDYSNVKTFNLDEYVGLSHDHISSYGYYMNEELFNHINVKKENINIPDGEAEDLDKHCKDYGKLIASTGGIDIQILGVGENGHIAFNEPGEEVHAYTHVANLTPNTIEVNSRFFNSVEEVPTTALSMGIGEILKAKKIILLANGPKKTPVIKKLLSTNMVSANFPVSFLLLHPDVTVIVDEEAYRD